MNPPKVAIVGGGPSGLAVAIAARERGWDVTVFDQGHPPRDKACGEGLMPAGLQVLQSLGVLVDNELGEKFEGIRYVDSSSGGESLSAEGRFPEGEGRGIRRKVLHERMVERARSLGADLRWGSTVKGLSGNQLLFQEHRETFDWIVGADGLHSSVRKWAGMAGKPRGRLRYGARQHFRVAPWSPWVEVHFSADCEAYITPIGPEEVGVALLWSGGPARYSDLLSRFPALQARLEGTETLSKVLGAGPLRQEVAHVLRGPVALVGDASGYLDAITGEGLAMSFRQAQSLVAAIDAGVPERYISEHKAIVRPYLRMTHLVLLATRHQWLRRRIIRALGSEPTVFSLILGAVEGQRSIQQIGVGGASRLTWRTIAG
ncbi:MAG: NAD(P)/FAD-dependent oxidoreductase [Myxococcota bacterium]|nr:NAD(P)/FAD-dependent oxidoreductase [Myxococcota bacterium]